jgi:hypothetical protein
MLVRLRAHAVKTGGEDMDVDSSTGVRQGACGGSTPFLFIMQAALGTAAWPVAKPAFRTRAGGVTSGGKAGAEARGHGL